MRRYVLRSTDPDNPGVLCRAGNRLTFENANDALDWRDQQPDGWADHFEPEPIIEHNYDDPKIESEV